MRISDWSSDVCSSDLARQPIAALTHRSITNARVDALAAGVDIGGAVPLGSVIDETIERERVMLHRPGESGEGDRVGMVGHGWSGWTIPEIVREGCRGRGVKKVKVTVVIG